MTGHRSAQSTFALLFVCTGNVYRSPFAEILTRHLLRERFGVREAGRFEVSSAGTDAVSGARLDPLCRAELAPWGLAGTTAFFRARLLDIPLVAGADLVLTAERWHRHYVVDLAPSALATTFCVREFVRLVDRLDVTALPPDLVSRAHCIVSLARRRRGMVPYAAANEDAIPDPAGRSAVAHRTAATLTAAAVRTLVALLADARPRPVTGAHDVVNKARNGPDWP